MSVGVGERSQELPGRGCDLTVQDRHPLHALDAGIGLFVRQDLLPCSDDPTMFDGTRALLHDPSHLQ